MAIKEAQSFEQAIEENKDSIYRICRIYAVSPLEPQDLFQEVVVQIWKAFSTFEGKSKMSTWIYRVALNVCLSAKRKTKMNSDTIRLESIQFSVADTPDQHDEEKYKALKECISSLNERDESIVVLLLDNLPYKDIASISGLTENHIAVVMKRIRATLLKCINSKIKIK